MTATSRSSLAPAWKVGAVFVAAFWMCHPTKAHAYRTGADTGDFESTSRVAWGTGHLSLVYHNAGAPLEDAEVRSVLYESFTTWMEPDCSAARITLAAANGDGAVLGDGINTVQWITSGWRDLGYDDEAGGITELEYVQDPSAGWTIAEADILLNAEHHRWALTAEQAAEGVRDLHSVVTHELGHALGLMHPCEDDRRDGAPDCQVGDFDVSGTMYPDFSTTQARLDEDAKAGICFLYPGEGCDRESCQDGYVCSRGDCVPACGGDICEPAQVCVEDKCVEAEEVETKAVEAETSAAGDCASSGCEAALRLPLGDPCESNGECGSASCRKGYCAERCTSAADCSGAQECSAKEGGEGWCGNSLMPLGGECTNSLDCLGFDCLQGAEEEPICTRECGPGIVECPTGWRCEKVEARDVCTPEVASKSCALAPGRSRESSGLGYLCACMGVLLLVRRRP